jgi:hypothetical protein
LGFQTFGVLLCWRGIIFRNGHPRHQNWYRLGFFSTCKSYCRLSTVPCKSRAMSGTSIV